MSRAFPTKEELGRKYERGAILLTFVTFSIWLVSFYFLAVLKMINFLYLMVFSFVYPICFLIAMRYSYLTIEYKDKSVSGFILLAVSTVFFLLSASMWFLPIF